MKKLIQIAFILIALSLCINAYAEDDSRDSDSPYGALSFVSWNHPWNCCYYDTFEKIEKEARLIKEVGIGFARMDFLWYDLEPAPGVFDYEKHDRIVNIFLKNNIKILAILHYNPSWRSDAEWNAPPNLELFTKYACAAIEHFKDRIKYWEIWNEPDEKTYWAPQDDMRTYTELLKKVYPAMKKADPTCKVVLGGLSSTITISLDRVYKNGGKDYFDIVNIHPFTSPLYPNAIESVHGIYKGTYKIMQKHKDEAKRIWFTEIGCPGVRSQNKDNGWWEGKSPTEIQQAEWVKEVYANCLKWPNVDKVFWAFFRDTDDYFKSGVDYFGLVRKDFGKKPSYNAYKEIAKQQSK